MGKGGKKTQYDPDNSFNLILQDHKEIEICSTNTINDLPIKDIKTLILCLANKIITKKKITIKTTLFHFNVKAQSETMHVPR